MKAKYILSSVIVISILIIKITFAAPPRYEIIDLGTLGGRYSYARAINDTGQVVGWSSTADGVTLAFLWDPVNGMIDLGILDGQHSQAKSINRAGHIVGQAYTASGYWRATLFHPAGEGKNIDLGTLGGDRSFASSINDNGQIVGCAQIASGELHATLFDPTGGKDNIDLGTLGGDESWASSINNSCQIVGTAYCLFTSPDGRLPPVTSSFPRATLFDPTGQSDNIDLGALPYIYGGRYCSGAMSINDSGQIVGAAWNEDPDPFVQENSNLAVLFDPTGGENNIFLGTLGWNCSSAYSINNRDQIIGWGGFCSNNLCGTRPALFDPNGVDPNGFDPTGQDNNVNLYDLIDPCCGWILQEVWSINNSGWIVGQGINPDGETHAFLMTPVPPKIIYVDDDASGANDGSSWADAYNYLQDALATAWSGDEIHVAQGIYTPDSNSADPNGSGDREATFQLINGVTIKGGYAGTGSPDPNAHDIDLYETILSGDLNGDDVDIHYAKELMDEPTRAENSYHVVTGSETDSSAILNGFTITGGNANEPLPPVPAPLYSGIYNYSFRPTLTSLTSIGSLSNRGGGGMYNYGGNPTLSNCTLRVNSARYGGGMENRNGSNPTLTSCTFSGNSAIYSGGGLSNSISSPSLSNCTFSGNVATSTYSEGGGMCNSGNSSPILTNCTFIDNSAEYDGGGIYNIGGSPVLVSCIFSGNSAGWGGAMYSYNSSPMLTNCNFSGNSAYKFGGGINSFKSSPKMTNCTFSGNSSDAGGGMQNYQSNSSLTNCRFSGNVASDIGGGMRILQSSTVLINCTFAANSAINGNALACDSYQQKYPSNVQVTNCILWNGGDEIWNNDTSTISIKYSDVQYSWPGEGNIDADPLFFESGYWDTNDVWVDGDYHLLPESPCIDAGDPNYLAEPNETDLDGNPRVINDRIDMGAYEAPIFAEAKIEPDTLNLQSKGKWITAYIWLPEDYNVTDIDSNSVLLEGQIKPERFSLTKDNQIAIAKFDRKHVQNILSLGQIELIITGRLTDGTVFEGTGIIKVIDKTGNKSVK